MKKIKISERLVLYFVFIGIVSIAGVSFLTYYQSRKALLERSFEQLKAIRNLKKHKIEGLFSDRIRDVLLLSRSSDVKNIITRIDSRQGLPKDSYIYNNIYSSPYFKRVIFCDFGQVLIQACNTYEVSSDSLMQSKTLQILIKKSKELDVPFVVDFSAPQGDSLTLILCCAVQNQEDPMGFIALEMAPGIINNIMLESISPQGFGESGESYLVGNDRLMRSTSRFNPRSVMSLKVQTEAVEQAFENNEGTIITEDYRDIMVLSSFCRLNIAGPDWILLSEIDLKEVMKPVTGLRNQLLLLSMLLIVAVFFVALFFSRKLAAPIVKIKEAALRVSEGDFPTIDMSADNEEINELLRTFNYMSAQLKEKKEQVQTEQLKQVSAMLDGQETERKRLSFELHDGLGQSLVALKYKLESLQKHPTDRIKQELKELEVSMAETIEEVRQMSFNLMPAILSELGLVLALKNLCQKMQNQTGIQFIFETDGNFGAFSEKQSTYLFRMVQEGLNNAVKHAAATLVSVHLIEFPDFYMLIIEDNGTGFNYSPQLHEKGHGLYSIKERTDILKGKLIVQTAPGEGTVIRVKIPKQ